MAIQIVETHAAMKKQLEVYVDKLKRGVQLCATLIGTNECEVDITYRNGIPYSYSIIDTKTGAIIQTDSSLVGKYNIVIPATIPVANGSVRIFGCGHIVDNSIIFYTTDFIYDGGQVEYYSDRINVLASWGFSVAEVSSFPINQALEKIEQIKAAFPKAYGLFITRDAIIPNRIEAPFFYRF